MKKEFVNKVYLKLRDLLLEYGYNNGTGIGFNSYDGSSKYPELIFDGEKRKITFFAARGKDTISVVFYYHWHERLININDLEPDNFYEVMNEVYNCLEETNTFEEFCES